MKSLMRLACLGAVAMAFVACEEDKHICTLPSFAGFRIEPTVWNAGDSVTITAVQQSLGDLLYKAEYHWSVECTDTTFTKDYNVVYDADKSNPYIGIRLPDDFRSRMAKINLASSIVIRLRLRNRHRVAPIADNQAFTVVLRLRLPVNFMVRGVAHTLFLGDSPVERI